MVYVLDYFEKGKYFLLGWEIFKTGKDYVYFKTLVLRIWEEQTCNIAQIYCNLLFVLNTNLFVLNTKLNAKELMSADVLKKTKSNCGR